MNLNLLPSRAKFQMARINTRRLVKKILIWTAAGWILLVGILLLAWFVFTLQLNSADKKYKTATADYNALGDYAVTSLQLKYRAKLVGSLLKSRFEYGAVLEKIRKFFPPEVQMESYELEPPSAFSLSGKCSSNECMTEVEKRVKEINTGESSDFKSVDFSQLGWDEGEWKFSMEVAIK